MAYKLLGQDCAVETCLGAIANGQAQTFSTMVDRKSLARRISIDEESIKTELAALGDGLEKVRPRRSRFSLDLELYIGDAGALFAGKVGYAIKVQHVELSTLTKVPYVGMITKRSIESPDGEAIERITVEGGIEGHTYVGVYA